MQGTRYYYWECEDDLFSCAKCGARDELRTAALGLAGSIGPLCQLPTGLALSLG